jgi:hypothetical protein
MKKPSLLVAMATRWQPCPETQESLAKLSAGFALETILIRGCSDVTLARNMLLTRAWQLLLPGRVSSPVMDLLCGPHEGPESEFAGVLCIDDDMVFSLETVQKLLTVSERTGLVTAAAYGHTNGDFAATSLFGSTYEGETGERHPLFLTGLGLSWFPRAVVLKMAKGSTVVQGPNEQQVIAFTRSVPGDAMWLSDDYYLCNRVGGVALVARAGHVKSVVIWPDTHSFDALTAPAIGGH